jgi:hypothetical protein
MESRKQYGATSGRQAGRSIAARFAGRVALDVFYGVNRS